MARRKKPKSISVTLNDRKIKKSLSFTVYDTTLRELEKKFKKMLK